MFPVQSDVLFINNIHHPGTKLCLLLLYVRTIPTLLHAGFVFVHLQRFQYQAPERTELGASSLLKPYIHRWQG